MKQILFTNYTLITQLRISYYTYKEIAETLSLKYNKEITAINIRDHNPVNQKFISLLLLSNVDSLPDKITPIRFYNLFIIHDSAKNMLPEVDFEKITINKDNITQLPDQISMLYAKRFLNLYTTPDEFLIQQQKEKHPNIETTPLTELQAQIHKNFESDAKNLLTEVKQNFITFLTNNITRIYFHETN